MGEANSSFALESSGIQDEITKLNAALAQFMAGETSVQLAESSFSKELSSLTKNLNRLFAHHEELKRFSIDLAEGNLSASLPQRENRLAGPLKSLHAQMLHLTWQAKEVADGNYNLSVDFMGEFSEAFNRMILQLGERETQLVQGQKALLTVLEHTPSSVVVVNRETGTILFQNEAAQLLLASDQLAEHEGGLTVEQALIGFCKECSDAITWELCYGKPSLYLSVYSSQISWRHEAAHLHVLRDVTKEKQKAEELRTFAYHDHSTGVGNRNSGLEYLGRQLEKQEPFAAAFIDMDGLKHINDTFGHVAGDSALRELAQTLLGIVRDNDCVFRMGGDEFLIVFHKSATDIVERIITRVRRALLVKNEQLDYDIAFSVGAYMYDGREPLGVEELLRRADNIMYLEKRQKKGVCEELHI